MHLVSAILVVAAIAIGPGLAVGRIRSTTLIDETCATVSSVSLSYDYCVHALSDDRAGVSATDTRELAIAAAKLTARNVTSTLRVLNYLVADLSECIGFYKDMGKLVASALDDLRGGGEAASAVDKLNEASGVPMGSCDILLFEGRSKKDPMSEENYENELVSNLATKIMELASED